MNECVNECRNEVSRCLSEDRNPEDVRPITTPAIRYNINIESLNRGFVVRVGCQSFAISSKQELIKLFNAYVENPEKVEMDWMAEKKLPE